MSDLGRKDFSDKVAEKVQPQSTKSTTDKVSETVTGLGDKAARGAQPDDTKSTAQSLGDKASRSKDVHTDNTTTSSTSTTGSSGGIIDQAKHAVGLDKH